LFGGKNVEIVLFNSGTSCAGKADAAAAGVQTEGVWYCWRKEQQRKESRRWIWRKKNECSEKAFTTNICFDIIILSGCDFIKNSCEYI